MISVCIPTYNQFGVGGRYLTELLDSLTIQSGVFEVVISDNSDDNLIENLCMKYAGKMDIKYFRNTKKGIAHNTNHAISKASYSLIKIMYMDDLLLSGSALHLFAEALQKKDWAVSDSWRIDARGNMKSMKKAFWSPRLIEGMNTIGMPSVVAFRKSDVYFDAQLHTLVDCEFYWLLMKKFGDPVWIRSPLVAQRDHDYSASVQMKNTKVEDYLYIKQKHML